MSEKIPHFIIGESTAVLSQFCSYHLVHRQLENVTEKWEVQYPAGGKISGWNLYRCHLGSKYFFIFESVK